jgi:hypothetical protein
MFLSYVEAKVLKNIQINTYIYTEREVLLYICNTLLYILLYIYIYKERESERERQEEGKSIRVKNIEILHLCMMII